MLSLFLFLLPMVPFAVFHASLPAGARLPAWKGAFPKALPLHPCRPSGAPVRPDAGGPASPFSRAAVRKASRGWEWKRLESPGWKLLMTDNFVLRGDVGVAGLREAGTALEEFLRMLRSSIGGDPAGLMFSARLFRHREDFLRYAARRGAANAESFYDPRTGELVLCMDEKRGRDWLRRALAHEFTHEYMDRVWDCTRPLWFAEGMAEYFAGFAVRGGRARPGAVDRKSLLLLRLDRPLPLAEFLALDRADMYGPRFVLLYAQAWSLVHYLFSREDETIDLLLRGESLEEVEELEGGWRKYIEALK